MTEQPARDGFALLLAILAVVVAGALIVATHAAVNLEHLRASATINRQRAFAASEHALWSSIANWDSTNDLLRPGGSKTATLKSGGDSATITTIRLNQSVYWLTAEAEAGDPVRRARRRTGVNVRVTPDSAGQYASPLPRAWVELH
ncbi:MAG: hypothetical protein H0W42_09445 [Gemmatimonadaceae bacterium]|nr:hypothetical protein [Gemmatimonadaceae bacterium]